jgi:dTDP-4-amino-4,6-dideoxygalactose transaminase
MPILFESSGERDSVYSLLIEKGIKPRKYFFPLTVNFDYFKKEGFGLVEKYGLENATKIADRVLCLPLHPSLEASKVEYITSLIEENHKLYF